MSDDTSTNQNIGKSPMISRIRNFVRHSLRFLISSMHIPHVAPVALLIDGDNVSSNLIAEILVEAGKFGGVIIRRVYGNWASPATKHWQDAALRYGLKQIHQEQAVVGKNAADIALVVDAMDLFYRDGIQHFCLVASDSDYTPLVRRLRDAGCLVLGIGDPKTHPALMKACTVFVSTEQLAPPIPPTKRTTASPKAPVNTSKPVQPVNKKQEKTIVLPTPVGTTALSVDGAQRHLDPHLITLLKTAYLQESKEKVDGWVDVPTLFSVLTQHDSNFKAKDYGYKDMPTLVKSCTELFETRKQTKGKTRHLEVKLLNQKE